jgi:hypothetical protein
VQQSRSDRTNSGLPLVSAGAALSTDRLLFSGVGVLIYDATDSGVWQVYNGEVGNELGTLRAQLASLQAEIARLQQQRLAAPTAPTSAPSGSAVTSEEIAQAAGAAFSKAFVAAFQRTGAG